MSENSSGNPKSRPDKAVFGIALLLAGMAGVIAWDAAHLSSNIASYSRVGAEAFPYAVAILLLIVAIGTAVAAVRGTFPEREKLDLGPVAWIVGGLIGQIVLVGFAGFSLATGVLFGLAARGFGGKPLWLTIPAGTALSFLLYVLFAKGLQLSLPAGPLERLI